MTFKIIKGEKTFLNLDKLLKDNKSKLSVGFFKGQMRKSGNKDIPQAQIVYWNEFGTDDGKIPPRPFMRLSIEKNNKKWLNFTKKALLNNNLDFKKAINQLGLLMVGDIQKEITDLKTPPNAESTIKKKGSSNPLIDTGLMRNSVKHKIE